MFNKKEDGNHNFTCLGDKNNLNANNVLFFHGLGGDGLGTWTNDNGNLWPHDLQNSSDINSTVWLANYPTKRIKDGLFDSSMVIREHAEAFITSMEYYDLCNKPFVCVCHSLGGLIVKKIMLICEKHKQDSDHKICSDILDNFKGIFFIATPHEGSGVASVLKKIFFITQETAQLDKDNDELLVLKRDFMALSNTLNVFVQSFYEKKPLHKIGMIVNQSSAESGCLKDIPKGINENHISISKLNSLGDDLGKNVINYLKKISPMPKPKTLAGRQPHINPEKFIKGALVNPFDHSVNVNLIKKFIENEEVIPARFFYDTEQCAENWCEFAAFTSLTSIGTFLKDIRVIELLKNWGNNSALPYVSVGPGDGKKDLEFLSAAKKNGLKNFNYLPLDISIPLIKKASHQVIKIANRSTKVDLSFLLGDLESIQYSKEYLPKERKIISVLGNTIGNLMYDDQVISNLHKVMSKGDILFLEVRSLDEKKTFMDDNKEGEESDHITKASAFSLGPLQTAGFNVSDGSFRIVEDLSKTYAHIEKTETAIIEFKLRLEQNGNKISEVKLDKINFYHKRSMDLFLESGSRFKILHSDTINGDIFYFLEKNS